MTKVYTKNITPVQRKLVRDLIPFCAKKLMPRIKDLQITVIGVKDLVENEGIHADVIYEYVDVIVRPKDYTIRVDLMDDLQEFVRVICHEMVHVKQWAPIRWITMTSHGKSKLMAARKALRFLSYKNMKSGQDLSMELLKIIKCSDHSKWYSTHVGKTFPLIETFPTEYLTRQLPDNQFGVRFLNYIAKEDAVLVSSNEQ